MSFFLKNFALQRIRRITIEEILQYAQDYGFSIQVSEAEQIHEVLQTTDFDPFSISDHKRLLTELQFITNEETAEKAEELLMLIMQKYNFEHYLYE